MLSSGRMEEFVTEEEEPWYDQQDLEQGKTSHHPILPARSIPCFCQLLAPAAQPASSNKDSVVVRYDREVIWSRLLALLQRNQ